jgi:hypothetical protein
VSAYRIVYTRRWDRFLAVVWPPKRRRLRMIQALIDGPEGEALQRRIAANLRDLMLYGTSYCDPQGNRIDPTTVKGLSW